MKLKFPKNRTVSLATDENLYQKEPDITLTYHQLFYEMENVTCNQGIVTRAVTDVLKKCPPYPITIQGGANYCTVNCHTDFDTVKIKWLSGEHFDRREFTNVLDQRMFHPLSHAILVDRLSKSIESTFGFSSIMHIAMKKSGGTLLTRIMESLFAQKGWLSHATVPAFGDRHMEICLNQILLGLLFHPLLRPVFFKQTHVGYSKYSADIFRKINGLPILFSLRNVYDQAYSQYMMMLKDREIRNANDSRKSDSLYLLPSVPDWLDEKDFLDYVIKFDVPEFCRMTASWLNYFNSSDSRLYIIEFEKFVEDKQGTIKNIVETFNLPFSINQIEKAIDFIEGGKTTRLVVGKKGYGREQLSKQQKGDISEIIKMTRLDELAKKHDLSITDL
ncbi:hypothetical protein N9V13_05260 [Betaproteobacteria bacterium]|nr:hypothetical protein [Betaproteobacteria bacterium]